MVRILAEDFNELDLSPDYEFQIEMSNPMLDTGHLPEIYSTQIAFPPSPTNREKFGYFPVLMRPPSVQRLAASVWIGGVPFIYGTLVYDGIEDGNLLYTFTGKIPDLEAKIWDQQLLEFTTDNLPAADSNLFRTPLVIRSNNVAMQPYLNGAVDDNLWVKYWNYKTEGKSFDYMSFLPAIPISAIISWLGMKTPYEFRFLLESVSIIGRFHEYAAGDVVVGDISLKASRDGSRISTTSRQRAGSSYAAMESASAGGPRRRTSKATDIASFLPDITFADLLKGVGSMLCSSFYAEGKTLRMVRNATVLNADPLNWSGKVSDLHSAAIQHAATYKFGYGSEKTSKPELNPRGINYVEAGAGDTFDPSVILKALQRTGLYSIVWDKTTGDIYSGRTYEFGKDGTGKPSGYTGPDVYDCDVIYHNAKPVSLDVEDEDGEVFDNSCAFELVRCVPEKIFPNSGSGSWPSDSDATYRMTPIVDPMQVSDSRDSKVYVGIIDNLLSQMTDHDQFLPTTIIEEKLLGTNSLTPEDLWENHHKDFADWMSKRRQSVKAAVNLTPSDLHAFRLYHPVYFAGRKWVVKQLFITARAASDDMEVTGEFVEI